MASAAASAWATLGKLLIRRRAQIDPRYMNRSLFAAERRINPRLAADIEKGRRQNFDEPALAALEVAYMLRPDAIARFIAGTAAELEVAAVPGSREHQLPAPEPDDPGQPHRLPFLYDPALEMYLPGIAREVEEARGRSGRRNVTGDEAFPSNDLEAEAWDDPSLTEDESMRDIARMRRWLDRRRERGSERGTGLWRT